MNRKLVCGAFWQGAAQRCVSPSLPIRATGHRKQGAAQAANGHPSKLAPSLR